MEARKTAPGICGEEPGESAEPGRHNWVTCDSRLRSAPEDGVVAAAAFAMAATWVRPRRPDGCTVDVDDGDGDGFWILVSRYCSPLCIR